MGIERRLGKTVDWTLILLYLLLVLTGLLNIYASIHSTESSGFMDLASRSGRQLLWAGISLAIGAVILFIINPRIWEVLASPAYFTVLVLLVAVIFIGAEHKGSHSWFSVGGVSFQPAEISKITTSLLLAAVTSAISMLEVIVRYFIEEWKLSRNAAVIVSMVLIILLGCVCSLSQGTLSGITILGNNIFDFFDVISSDVFITVGSLIMVLFAGWRLKRTDFLDELTGHGTSRTPRWIFTYVWFMVRWVAPIVIIVIMLSNFLL